MKFELNEGGGGISRDSGNHVQLLYEAVNFQVGECSSRRPQHGSSSEYNFLLNP